jgi:transglutaminase-like putative cysteine protease
VWVPSALPVGVPYQTTLSQHFAADGGAIRLAVDRANGLGIVVAEFPAGVKPIVTVHARVATRPYAVNLRATGRIAKSDPATLDRFLRPTRLLPTDGIVKTTANEIVQAAKTDVEKARAIFEWIVENTFREPTVRGCGVGDIRFMLESKNLGGKCADLNALYVGLARAAGLPARDVYGLRVGPSALGYKSLGTSSEVVTKAQHCRAEVYLAGHGWVPIDPADVRKVMLEEPPGKLTMTDPLVRQARERLFGSWEMNWIAYNYAQDVKLPGSTSPPLGFLMYPQAETASGRLDGLDPDGFKYEISSREVG